MHSASTHPGFQVVRHARLGDARRLAQGRVGTRLDVLDAERNRGVISILRRYSERYADRTALAFFEAGEWRTLSFGALRKRACNLAATLAEQHHVRGERIAILSEDSPNWPVAFFAIVLCGGTAVPLDPKLTEHELRHIVRAAEPSVILASKRLRATAERVATAEGTRIDVVALEDQAQTSGSGDAAWARRGPTCARRREDVALLTFTSGTTGTPKGVMTTFENLLFEVEALADAIPATDDEKTLSILPLHHLFGLTAGLLSSLWRGSTACHCTSLFPDDIAACIRSQKPTRIVAVPLFLQLLRRQIDKRVQRLPWWKRTLCNAALHGRMGTKLCRRVMASARRTLFGGLREVVSGGAPLDPQTARFFERLGIDVYQGYGLTETSPVVTTNTPAHNRIGSVGRPLPGVEVRIRNGATTGEIQTRGRHVMRGYYRRDDLTSNVVSDDGWFSTGDIGRLDADGYLYLTGRLKNIVVLGSGKNVHPEEVECFLARGPFEAVCVLGTPAERGVKRASEEVCAVVIPDEALRRRYEHQPALLQDHVRNEAARLCSPLSHYKRPTQIVVREEPFPLTSTRKIKRRCVAEWIRERRRNSA